jgi:dethiobiotin synthetase
MKGFVVLGTDTDAGKTAFAAQWMTAFADQFAYWKPVETGESDSETIRRLVPSAKVFPPHARFRAPLAPVLAATQEGRAMPGVAEVLAAVHRRGTSGRVRRRSRFTGHSRHAFDRRRGRAFASGCRRAE